MGNAEGSHHEGPRVEQCNIVDLVPDAHNANQGTERGSYMLGRSLERFGAGRSILLDKNLRIIAGNKTHAKAGEVGIEGMILVHTDGSKLVGVVRDDLDLDDPEARALAYADNRISEVDLAFDAEQIARDQLAGVDMMDFWRQDEIDKMTATAAGLNEGDLLDIAEEVETPTQTTSLVYGKIRIPLNEDEVRDLDAALAEYGDTYGSMYGFVRWILSGRDGKV